MYATPRYLQALGAGSISIMEMPSGGNLLAGNLSRLKDAGIDRVLSFLPPSEAHSLGLADEASVCSKLGIEFLNFPIADRGIPGSIQAFAGQVDRLYRSITAGSNALVHCKGGIGRTGLFAASVLIRHGHTAAEAFDRVSAARGFRIPDTQTQIDWVYEHEATIRDFPG